MTAAVPRVDLAAALPSLQAHGGYDPSFVRYFGAVLVTAMAQRDRGNPDVQSAWSDAIDMDPLPDTRRARDKVRDESPDLGKGAGE